MPINGRALAVASVGSVLIYSGIKGWSIIGTLGDLVVGTKPNQPIIAGLVDPNTPTESTNGVTGNIIADTAMQYIGHRYVWGGAPGPDGSKGWDCSSFVNYVVGVKLLSAIPGYGMGKYNGKSHGPTTANWAIWSGLKSIQESDVRAGDIIVWAGHMGIAVSNTEYVSALNPSDGTKVTQIRPRVNGPIVKRGRYGG